MSAKFQEASFAIGGGVHTTEDVIKSLMSGADVVQLVSEVLQQGASRFTGLRAELASWLVSHEYESLTQLRGSMNQARSPAPA